jgi:hypothetical protein
MVEVQVNPGICGLKTTISANSEDAQTTELKICTDCPSLKPFEEELKEADGYEVCFGKPGDSLVFELANKYCRHPGCPVPVAIIKAIEVACGLALPKNVEISIEKK